MSKRNSLNKLLGATLAAGVACAVAFTPLAAIAGVAVDRTNATMQSNLADLTDGSAPGVTTITDSSDNPIAWVYSQRRYEVPSEGIAQVMKDAIVSIEDRRFYEHKGVDIQGNLRAIATNLLAGGVEQGASTIDQQYVKNYLLLVASDNADDQAAAIETSIPRKLREMRMASKIDQTMSKDEILTRYLNLVPFGNGAYGIEAAARTYFGISANQLSVPQAAMLAGMVQSSSYLDPYTNADAVLDRRNTVLDAMVSYGAITAEDADRYHLEPLGVLETPESVPNGCIAAGNNGFFCDYVLNYLSQKGLDADKLSKGSYTIKTTLDQNVQDSIHNAATSQVPSGTNGVADVMNVVEPGSDTRRILGMTSSRDYGLDLESGQTVFPQASSLVGNGAGSIFKIFTAAAALEQGYGLDTTLQVPTRYVAQGMGEGGASGCPAGSYCVENTGTYPATMSLRDALAQSPNTPFVQLIEKVGVSNVVDLAVKMGLRAYTDAGTFDGQSSIADYVKDHNLGSFTLGPTAVNALELSNVAATIASGGTWCEPTPIDSVTDQDGKEVYIDKPSCEQAIPTDVANALANGLSQDAVKGTAADAAKAAGWTSPIGAKTGTTESHQSAAFLGFNSKFAAATYIYNDGTTVAPLCTSPITQCSGGSLYGGDEPAATWFRAANAVGASSGTLPGYNPSYNAGAVGELSSKYRGKSADSVRQELTSQGYDVSVQTTTGDGTAKGMVMRVEATLPLTRGSKVTLYVSDGTTPRVTTPTPTSQGTQQLPAIPQVPGVNQDDLNSLANQIQQLLNP